MMETYLLIVLSLLGLLPVLFLAFKVQFVKNRVITFLETQSARDIDITSASISRGAVYFDVEYTDNNGEKIKRSGIVHGVIIPDGEIYWNDHN
jgi:hypothetical protein